MRAGALVLIKGAGDLATGCAVRLSRSGFGVVMTELPAPTAVRRAVAFSEASVAGTAIVEGVIARRVEGASAARAVLRRGGVAVLVDPGGERVARLAPAAVVDARMAKENLGTTLGEAPVVVGLGPGFVAGRDVHAVIETNRGHDLGRVILEGAAEPNTGIPGDIDGHGAERVLRAPAAGTLRTRRAIGDRVGAGEVVAEVEGQLVRAAIDGVLRGLLRDGDHVRADQKIGDVDPRARPEHCFSVSDKARAVAGGVLEAILYLSNRVKPSAARRRLPTTTRSRRGAPRARSRRARS